MTDREYRYYFEKYNKPIIYFSSQMVGDDWAEDITSDVFLKAWKVFDFSNRSEGEIKTWLYQCAKNRCLDFLRAKKRHGADHEDIYFMSQEHVEVLEIKSELIQKIDEEIKKMGPVQKKVAALLRWEFKPIEIAKILNMPPGTVGLHVSRIRAKLKPLIT